MSKILGSQKHALQAVKAYRRILEEKRDITNATEDAMLISKEALLAQN